MNFSSTARFDFRWNIRHGREIGPAAAKKSQQQQQRIVLLLLPPIDQLLNFDTIKKKRQLVIDLTAWRRFRKLKPSMAKKMFGSVSQLILFLYFSANPVALSDASTGELSRLLFYIFHFSLRS